MSLECRGVTAWSIGIQETGLRFCLHYTSIQANFITLQSKICMVKMECSAIPVEKKHLALPSCLARMVYNTKTRSSSIDLQWRDITIKPPTSDKNIFADDIVWWIRHVISIAIYTWNMDTFCLTWQISSPEYAMWRGHAWLSIAGEAQLWLVSSPHTVKKVLAVCMYLKAEHYVGCM